jgi:hypothetical protein
MKSILTVFTLLATGATLGAQTTSVSGLATGNVVAGVQVPVAIQNKQQAFINSQAQFAAHNFTAAESVLEAANLATTGTPEWHVESGFSLIRMAFRFKSQGDAAFASAIAQLALRHLKLADQTFSSNTSPGEIANEKGLTGYVYQFLLGDRATAMTYYQAAVALSPNTGDAPGLLAAINASQAVEAQKQASVQRH